MLLIRPAAAVSTFRADLVAFVALDCGLAFWLSGNAIISHSPASARPDTGRFAFPSLAQSIGGMFRHARKPAAGVNCSRPSSIRTQ